MKTTRRSLKTDRGTAVNNRVTFTDRFEADDVTDLIRQIHRPGVPIGLIDVIRYRAVGLEGIPVLIVGIVSIAVGVLFFATLPGSLIFFVGLGILLVGGGAALLGALPVLEFLGPMGAIVLLIGLYIAHAAGTLPF
ncbi:MAG: hypothetical protein L3K16_08785 [Thermoplasmata archaeon]|nr:hypothetical protein [Thermoplasmata archaeon]